MARDHGAVPNDIELDAIESNNTTNTGNSASSNEVRSYRQFVTITLKLFD